MKPAEYQLFRLLRNSKIFSGDESTNIDFFTLILGMIVGLIVKSNIKKN